MCVYVCGMFVYVCVLRILCVCGLCVYLEVCVYCECGCVCACECFSVLCVCVCVLCVCVSSDVCVSVYVRDCFFNLFITQHAPLHNNITCVT